jgi:hypothetical protein
VLQANLVRQKSSRMLWLMLAIHWGGALLGRGASALEARLKERARRGLVTPSMEAMA